MKKRQPIWTFCDDHENFYSISIFFSFSFFTLCVVNNTRDLNENYLQSVLLCMFALFLKRAKSLVGNAFGLQKINGSVANSWRLDSSTPPPNENVDGLLKGVFYGCWASHRGDSKGSLALDWHRNTLPLLQDLGSNERGKRQL